MHVNHDRFSDMTRQLLRVNDARFFIVGTSRLWIPARLCDYYDKWRSAFAWRTPIWLWSTIHPVRSRDHRCRSRYCLRLGLRCRHLPVTMSNTRPHCCIYDMQTSSASSRKTLCRPVTLGNEYMHSTLITVSTAPIHIALLNEP